MGRFVGYVTGQRGAYQNAGVDRKSDEVAQDCLELRLIATPNRIC